MVEIGVQFDNGGICVIVVNFDLMIVIGQVLELNIVKIFKDMFVEVNLVMGEMFIGYVCYIVLVVDLDMCMFCIEVELLNLDGVVCDGVIVVIWLLFLVEMVYKIILVILMFSDNGVVGVCVVDEDNKIKFYFVIVFGGEEDGFWVVGLLDWIFVIVVGQEYVGDGEIVELVFEIVQVVN